MSDEARKKFMEKYGDVEVTFSSYYKYLFSYNADIGDGATLYVNVGGDADEIYRHEVSNNETLTVRQLDPDSGGVYKGGASIESF